MYILNLLGRRYPPEAHRTLSRLGVVEYKESTKKILVGCIAKYDIAVIGLGLVFDKKILATAKNLKVIATATTGLDHIDLDEARKRTIKILSLRGEAKFLKTITGKAELAMGLMIGLLRRIPHAFDDVKNGHWNRAAFCGANLYGKTLGIVGFGRLGRLMARYGEGFGMKVVFADPIVQVSKKSQRKVPFTELLKQSDIISIHAHLTQETENMFSTAAFARMKKSAILINTARGKIVDEKALLVALKKGAIAGYATDVLSDELSFKNGKIGPNPLVEYGKKNKNIIITPHIGGMTNESREATDVFMAKKLERFLRTNFLNLGS